MIMIRQSGEETKHRRDETRRSREGARQRGGEAEKSMCSSWYIQGALQYELTRTALPCVRGGTRSCIVRQDCIEARKSVLVMCCTPPLYCTAMH